MRQRQAYLQALGLTAWERRAGAGRGTREMASRAPATETTAPPRPGVAVEAGPGSCLYVCGADDDIAGDLASDLARVLPEAPVWARLDPDGAGVPLEAAIAERLFTHVVVFGEAQARLVFDGEAPEQLGPARVAVAPDLGRLATDAEARKRCWFALRSAGCVGAS